MRNKLIITAAFVFMFLSVNTRADVFTGEWKLALLPNNSQPSENDPVYSLTIAKKGDAYTVEVKFSGVELDHFAESGNIKDAEYRNGPQMQEFMTRQEQDPDRYAKAMQNNMIFQKLRLKSEQYSGKFTGDASSGVITKTDNSVSIRYKEDGKMLFLDRMGYFLPGKTETDNNEGSDKAARAAEENKMNRDMAGKWKGTFTQSDYSDPNPKTSEFTATFTVTDGKINGFMEDNGTTTRIEGGFIGSDGNLKFNKAYEGVLGDVVEFRGEFKDGGDTVEGQLKSLSDSKLNRKTGAFTMTRLKAAAEEKENTETKTTGETKAIAVAKESKTAPEAVAAKSKAKSGTLLENMDEETLSSGVKYKSGCLLENPISTKVILDTVAAWAKDNSETPGQADYKKGVITLKQKLEDGTVITTKIEVNAVEGGHDVFFETTAKGAAKISREDAAGEYEHIVKVLEEEGK